MNGKSNSGHTHDDMYYTESEINSKFNQLNSDLNNIGNIYTYNITIAHAPQKTTCFGSMELPSGTFVITGSAKHSTHDGVCCIGISTSIDAIPDSNGQMIYGNENYDVNKGSVTHITNIIKPTIFYFQVWADSDFEIVPMSFIAVRIGE